ncbi:TetR/AcrR family transcriptional regulator [Kocuria tytonicola]|uniref:TetR/AcrR family transcriptional regulator n=1 Tax=Kocuria tytonicola TaxID=2055946 RepID=A0A3L9L467_9MICC|nr:TetR/AcrR family transcriptional regulator [Kocuria tytonicola]RLY91757.1 TetR/AcrR family transcriptional regulator [Kocuria tytonicola]
MPKLVNHASRKQELVRAVWRVLARDGASGMTMRQVSAEAGYANGALKPYFPTKADLIDATYTFVFQQTNERVVQATGGLTGLAALEVFCREVMPLDTERLDEARVVLTFWQEAAHDPTRAEHNQRFMKQWRDSISRWLAQAREAGQVADGFDLAARGDALLTYLLGTQAAAALGMHNGSPAHLERQLHAQLDLLRAGRRNGPGTARVPCCDALSSPTSRTA